MGLGPAIAAALLTACISVAPPDRPDPGPAPEEGLADLGGAVELWGGWVDTGADEQALDSLELAHLQARRGDLEGASEALGEALALRPDEPSLLRARGALLAEMGYARAAELEFERAAELEPSCPGVWWALGCVRLELGLVSTAWDALQRARRLGEADPELLVLVARVHRERDRFGWAANFYAAAIAGDPGVDAERLIEAASLFAEDGARTLSGASVELALGWLDRAERLDPDSSRAPLVRALVQERHGDRNEAIDSFERALALETDPVRRRRISSLLASY